MRQISLEQVSNVMRPTLEAVIKHLGVITKLVKDTTEFIERPNVRWLYFQPRKSSCTDKNYLLSSTFSFSIFTQEKEKIGPLWRAYLYDLPIIKLTELTLSFSRETLVGLQINCYSSENQEKLFTSFLV